MMSWTLIKHFPPKKAWLIYFAPIVPCFEMLICRLDPGGWDPMVAFDGVRCNRPTDSIHQGCLEVCPEGNKSLTEANLQKLNELQTTLRGCLANISEFWKRSICAIG